MSSPFVPSSFSYGDLPAGGTLVPMIIAKGAPSNSANKLYPSGYLWLSDLHLGGTGALYVQAGSTSGIANWSLLSAASGALNSLSDGTITVTPSGGNIAIVGTANQITTLGSNAAHEITISLPAAITTPGTLTVTGAATFNGLVTLNAGIAITGGLTVDTLTSTGATNLATTGASTNAFGNTTS